jgi:DNA mismatch repair protein MutL
VNAVYGQENIRYCPHGRPVMITLTKRDIEKQFRRVL